MYGKWEILNYLRYILPFLFVKVIVKKSYFFHNYVQYTILFDILNAFCKQVFNKLYFINWWAHKLRIIFITAVPFVWIMAKITGVISWCGLLLVLILLFNCYCFLCLCYGCHFITLRSLLGKFFASMLAS